MNSYVQKYPYYGRRLQRKNPLGGNVFRIALRDDPDVILIGEMRDYETISLAMMAAETGHLVFGTLHTSSAAQTIDRIIDVCPIHAQDQVRNQLSNMLQGIIEQSLVPRSDRKGLVAAVEVMLGTLTGSLSFDPQLPDGWDGYAFKIVYRGRLIEVSVSREGTGLKLLSGEALTVMLHGHEVRLAPAEADA